MSFYYSVDGRWCDMEHDDTASSEESTAIDWGLFPVDPQLEKMLWKRFAGQDADATPHALTLDKKAMAAFHAQFPYPMAPHAPSEEHASTPALHGAQAIDTPDLGDGRIGTLFIAETLYGIDGCEDAWTQIHS